MTWPLKNCKPSRWSKICNNCRYKGGLDLLNEVIADGAKIPLPAVLAMETILKQDDARILAFWDKGQWWNIELTSEVVFSQEHVKLLKASGAEIWGKGHNAEWNLGP